MCRQIDDIADDIHNQLTDQIKNGEFSLQLDETTDNSRDAQIICYVRFVDFSEQNFVVELLFCKPTELGCRGIDFFNIIDNFFRKTNVSVYAQIVPMSGSCCGLRSLISKSEPMAKWTHCMIHREALVARELSPEFGETGEVITKIINYIKARPSKSIVFQKLFKIRMQNIEVCCFIVRTDPFYLENYLNESASWRTNLKIFI